MDNGILYVATDDDLIEEAQVASQSVRESMGEVPIAIATDTGSTPDGFDISVQIESPTYGFKDKILGMKKSPFERTLYLDTDTYLNDGVSDIFELLDHFDIAATHNPNRDLFTEASLGVPQSFPEYNSGVVAFKNPATADFFEAWSQQYSEKQTGDQPSFRKVMYESSVRIATLPREYNYVVRYPGHIVKDVKIFHGRLLDIKTLGAEKGVNIEQSVQAINAGEGHRLYAGGGLHVEPTISQRIGRSIESNGIGGTTRSVINKIYSVAHSGKDEKEAKTPDHEMR